MSKYAVIDVGTNSIKFHLAEQHSEGVWSVIVDAANISRLGAGMHATGHLQPAAMDRTIAVIADMIRIAREHRVEQLLVVGTMGLRTAKNAREFIQRVQQTCGVTIEVLPGAEEARLAYLAIKSEMAWNRQTVCIFDMGGGSTEFIVGRDDRVEHCISLNIGAFRYTEQLLRSDPVTPTEVEQTVAAIHEDLTAFPVHGPIDRIVGMGGGVTTICAVKYALPHDDPIRIQGATLELSEIERQIQWYQARTVAERKKIVGLPPERADVILAGVLIVKAIMTKVQVDIIQVSDRGIRHGILIDRFGGRKNT